MTTTKIVNINGKDIILKNVTPDFKNEEEREKVKRRIERDLYEVFKKYQ